jgi:hypothetical protein
MVSEIKHECWTFVILVTVCASLVDCFWTDSMCVERNSGRWIRGVRQRKVVKRDAGRRGCSIAPRHATVPGGYWRSQNGANSQTGPRPQLVKRLCCQRKRKTCKVRHRRPLDAILAQDQYSIASSNRPRSCSLSSLTSWLKFGASISTRFCGIVPSTRSSMWPSVNPKGLKPRG